MGVTNTNLVCALRESIILSGLRKAMYESQEILHYG